MANQSLLGQSVFLGTCSEPHIVLGTIGKGKGRTGINLIDCFCGLFVCFFAYVVLALYKLVTHLKIGISLKMQVTIMS